MNTPGRIPLAKKLNTQPRWEQDKCFQCPGTIGSKGDTDIHGGSSRLVLEVAGHEFQPGELRHINTQGNEQLTINFSAFPEGF